MGMAAKRVDVLNARCSVEIDAEMIQEKILSLPGCGDQINRMVERVRMRAMVEQFEKQPWFAQTTTNDTPGKAGAAGMPGKSWAPLSTTIATVTVQQWTG